MQNNIGKLFARILFVPFSAFFLYILLASFLKSLNNLSYNLTENSYEIFLRFDTLENVSWILFGLLSAIYLISEFAAFFNRKIALSKLLTNFRYAPIAILIFSGVVVTFYDLGMIEYSKWQIENYIFRESADVQEPNLILHNDYRHWCGNGAMAREKDLYFDTSIAGIGSENPQIRTRSWLMAYNVWDFFNGSESPQLDMILKKGCADSDKNVRNAAEKFLQWRNINCTDFLTTE